MFDGAFGPEGCGGGQRPQFRKRGSEGGGIALTGDEYEVGVTYLAFPCLSGGGGPRQWWRGMAAKQPYSRLPVILSESEGSR